MRRISSGLLCTLCIILGSACLVSAPANAASGYSLKLRGTADNAPLAVFDVQSFSWGEWVGGVASPPGAASALAHKAVAKPRVQGNLLVVGRFAGCQVGARYAAAELIGRPVSYRLADAVVVDCGTVAAAGGDGPMANISLNYTGIEF